MESYLEEMTATIDSLHKQTDMVKDIATIIQTAKVDGKQIFICGNGGSAAIASHFANDLHKKSFKVWALTDSVPSITMWANDTNYNFIFAYQMEGRAQKGDLLIVFSGSGSSKNIIQACHYAHAIGMTTIAIVGIDGGACKQYQSNLNISKLIHLPVDMYHSEDGFSIFSHWMTAIVE
jgi:D-sedoheptulose 7-phosphate isomerase